jgi:GNAT superfamily N-acetyltransferase
VRPARPQDRESVGEFLAGLSMDSRYRRFLGNRHITADLVGAMVTVAPDRLALIALDGDIVIGHAMAVHADEHPVDIGVVVAEAHQSRGIGRKLMHELSTALAAGGRTEVCCDVLRENHFVLDWLRRSLANSHFEPDHETITVHGTLTP